MSADGFDVVIVGAGVVGLAIAARLASDDRSVLILEREPGIARGVTSRNSEVIHAGIYYPADSLKATTCVAGRERLYAWCAEYRVDHKRLGKLIVATDTSEIPVLEDLQTRGLRNGVTGLGLIDAARVTALEPSVSAAAALESRETGIVDAHAFCLSLLGAAESRGAILALDREVTQLSRAPSGWQVMTRAGEDGREEVVSAECVIDAAGLAADTVAACAGLDVDALGWRQHPCKGDYFKLSPTQTAARALSRLIYPVPQQAGLGIHATLDLAGGVRFGPDTEYVPARDEFDVDPGKALNFAAAAARYLPGLEANALTPDYAGIRPKLAGPGESFRDFVIAECSDQGAPGFIACLGIESPGLTAALEIAERVADLA